MTGSPEQTSTQRSGGAGENIGRKPTEWMRAQMATERKKNQATLRPVDEGGQQIADIAAVHGTNIEHLESSR